MTVDELVTIEHDRYGRYMLPDPATGKKRAWTRVTTFADTLDDRYNLELWKLRQTAIGLAARADLLMGVAAARPDDKKAINRLCEQAMEAAKSSSGSNLGTALHRFTEAVDRGEHPNVPAPYDRDIEAYRGALAAYGMTVVAGMIERVVCIPSLGLCGTFDRLLDHHGTNRIGDVKTGAGIEWGMGSIAIQLACYAHGECWWDGDAWQPMPVVDLATAIVMHLPAGQARCDLLAIDIAAGWEAVEHAAWVRNWRKRKGLHSVIGASGASAPPPTPSGNQRTDWIKGRLAALPEPARTTMARYWPEGVPGLKGDHEHTMAELDAIVEVIDDIEAAHDVPFGETEPNPLVEVEAKAVVDPPRAPPDEGVMMAKDDVEALKRAFQALPDDQRRRIVTWQREAFEACRGFSPAQLPSARRFEILRACMAATAHLVDDELVRAAVAAVLDTDGPRQTSIPLGAFLGALTIDEATRLADLADRFSADPATNTTIGDDGLIRLAS